MTYLLIIFVHHLGSDELLVSDANVVRMNDYIELLAGSGCVGIIEQKKSYLHASQSHDEQEKNPVRRRGCKPQ